MLLEFYEKNILILLIFIIFGIMIFYGINRFTKENTIILIDKTSYDII